MESNILPSETLALSENHLKNNHGFDWGHCDGGNSMMSMAYLARWQGPVYKTDDPYNTSSNTSPSGLSPRKHVQEVLLLPPRASAKDNDNIKWALTTYGAVYANMHWDDATYNSITHAFYYSGSASTNHGVVIVGWDDNYSKNNFNSPPPGNGAFIVRNNWGESWGESGYFYISYYDSAFAMKDTSAVFVKPEPTSNYSHIYEYDPLGWVSSIGYYNSSGWFTNIFTAQASEGIKAVSFYAASPGSTYTVKVYKNVGNSPIDGTLALTQSGTLSVAGYHTIPLTTNVPVTNGQKFSVVVQINTPNYNNPIPIEYNMSNYSSSATASPGQSYISSDGISWTDTTTYWDPTANVCLKTFGSYTGIYYTLTVTKAGTGTGTVTSSPAGISCSADCQESLSSNTSVTLTAIADRDSLFVDWDGDCASCSASSSCSFLMTANKTCTARFLNKISLIQQLYIGYFNRASDPAGMDYWLANYDVGMSLTDIAQSFSKQEESKALYPYLSDNASSPNEFISSIYSNLLGRQADESGLNYWVTQLSSVLSTILCKFDKGANWAALFLSDLSASSTPSLTI